MSVKKVLKFGGTSLANPDRIREAASIVLNAAKKARVVVIVSAFQDVTNLLLECARLAELGNKDFQSLFSQIADRHTSALKNLHGGKPPKRVTADLQALLIELRDTLQGIFLLRHSSPRALDLTASFGERCSALIIASFLQRTHPACFVDSRELVKTDDQFTHAAVQFDKTNHAIQTSFSKLFKVFRKQFIPVVTGFIGSTDEGLTTTIGRNGSDYSAAIFGAGIECIRDRNLDRCGWDLKCRSSFCPCGIRCAEYVVRRSDGTFILWSEGASCIIDCTGSCQTYSYSYKEYVESGSSRNTYLASCRSMGRCSKRNYIC